MTISYHDGADKTTVKTDSIGGQFYQGVCGDWMTPGQMARLILVAQGHLRL